MVVLLLLIAAVSLGAFVMYAAPLAKEILKARTVKNTDALQQPIATLYRGGDLDLNKVINLIASEMPPGTVIGILTESPAKNIKPQQDETFERNIFVQKPVNPKMFLTTMFFNLLPDYFTLENELKFIEDMGKNATATAYDTETINTLINEIQQSSLPDSEKEFYTNFLLDVKSQQ